MPAFVSAMENGNRLLDSNLAFITTNMDGPGGFTEDAESGEAGDGGDICPIADLRPHLRAMAERLTQD